MSKELTSLPNIGKVLAEMLLEVGISTPEELAEVGSEGAFIRLNTAYGEEACMHKFFALEGAVQGIHWHDLDEQSKARVRAEFRQIKGRH